MTPAGRRRHPSRRAGSDTTTRLAGPRKGAFLPKGLVGRRRERVRRGLRCIVPKRCWYVSARVTRARRGGTEQGGDFVSALGRMTTGQIAVRRLTGKPLVYAEVADGGRARLFSKGCLEGRRGVAAAAALALAALGGGSAARAEARATPTLDRTYTCAVFFRGGRTWSTATPMPAPGGAGWARLPYAGLRTGVFSGAAGNLLAWITSGRRRRRPSSTRTTTRSTWTRSAPSACDASRAAGVRPGPAFAIGPARRRGCAARQRVRVLRAEAGHRARSRSPRRAGSPQAGHDFQTCTFPFSRPSSAVAVATVAGKPTRLGGTRPTDGTPSPTRFSRARRLFTRRMQED